MNYTYKNITARLHIITTVEIEETAFSKLEAWLGVSLPLTQTTKHVIDNEYMHLIYQQIITTMGNIVDHLVVVSSQYIWDTSDVALYVCFLLIS